MHIYCKLNILCHICYMVSPVYCFHSKESSSQDRFVCRTRSTAGDVDSMLPVLAYVMTIFLKLNLMWYRTPSLPEYSQFATGDLQNIWTNWRVVFAKREAAFTSEFSVTRRKLVHGPFRARGSGTSPRIRGVIHFRCSLMPCS